MTAWLRSGSGSPGRMLITRPAVGVNAIVVSMHFNSDFMIARTG